MREVVWTNFAISEIKNILFYYRMVASDKIADKIRKSIFEATKPLVKDPKLGAVEENLENLKQEHCSIVEGNYKIIYRITQNTIFITDIFDCRQNPQKMKKSS